MVTVLLDNNLIAPATSLTQTTWVPTEYDLTIAFKANDIRVLKRYIPRVNIETWSLDEIDRLGLVMYHHDKAHGDDSSAHLIKNFLHTVMNDAIKARFPFAILSHGSPIDNYIHEWPLTDWLGLYGDDDEEFTAKENVMVTCYQQLISRAILFGYPGILSLCLTSSNGRLFLTEDIIRAFYAGIDTLDVLCRSGRMEPLYPLTVARLHTWLANKDPKVTELIATLSGFYRNSTTAAM